MKFSKMLGNKCSRKARKAYFNAPSHLRRIIMSSRLSKALREKLQIRALPIKKGDEVLVVRGKYAKTAAKVISVNRTNYKILLDKVTITKSNGQQVNVPIHPSKVLITKLDTEHDKDRQALIERKAAGRKLSMERREARMKEVESLMEKYYPELPKDMFAKQQKVKPYLGKPKKNALDLPVIAVAERVMGKKAVKSFKSVANTRKARSIVALYKKNLELHATKKDAHKAKAKAKRAKKFGKK